MGRRRAALVPAGVGVFAGLAGAALAAVVAFLLIGLGSGSVDWAELFTSSVWDPAGGRFGAAAMIFGTVVVSAIALALAAPLGWAAAVAVNELAPLRWRRLLRAGTELLAVVPSIVYGLIGIAFVRPFVARLGDVPGGDSLLAAGLVLAVMVLPTIVAVSADALAGVPDSVREAAASCGLNRSEVIVSAVLPQARRGLGAAALLGLARALGETIAVFLVVGRADGRMLDGLGDLWNRLVRPGQTLTTKLNGPESVLAGTTGAHWAALCALGLLLLAGVVALTLFGERRAGARHRLSTGCWSRFARVFDRRFATRTAGGPRAGARAARDAALRTVVGGSVAVPLVLVVAVVGVVVARGSAALDPRFWWSASVGASGGGIRDQIVGTVLLVVAAGILAAPVGLALGLVVGEYAGARVSRWLRSLTLMLSGVPSIILGLWGYWLFTTRLGWGKSWLAGGIVLAVLAIPPVVVAVAAALAALPSERREAAWAAGLGRNQIVGSVLVPHALPALVTGLLLGLARAAGETAPLLFTAAVFSGAAGLPGGVVDAPVSSLPTHIFTLAQDAGDAGARDAVWGAALALIVVAGLLVLAAAPARRRLEAR